MEVEFNLFFFCLYKKSVKTDLMENGANSILSIAKVNKSDSGNYTCSIGVNRLFTTNVHVLNGELIKKIDFNFFLTFEKFILVSEESLAELYHGGTINLKQNNNNFYLLIILIVTLNFLINKIR